MIMFIFPMEDLFAALIFQLKLLLLCLADNDKMQAGDEAEGWFKQCN